MDDERHASRRDFLRWLAGGSGLLLLSCGAPAPHGKKLAPYDESAHYWGYAVDTTRCIGCCACMRACRAENDVPAPVVRTWIERYRVDHEGHVDVDAAGGEDPRFAPLEGNVVKAFFVPKLCNHCEKSVCNQVCPVGAAYTTSDGVVLVDQQHCIGCGYCVQACPYGSRFINPETHVADKCTLCYHRITGDGGLQPACVEACPMGARLFGDLRDERGELSTLLRQRRFRLLKPEMGTHPKCYYIGLDREVV